MKIWVYLDGIQQGPYNEFQISELPITAQTPVWYEGLPDWTPAGIAPATARMFGQETNLNSRAELGGTTDRSDAQDHTATAASGMTYAGMTAQPCEPCPPTFLAWAIILTVCCCTPTSVAAIITSIFVTKRYNNGDLAGSRRMSEVTEWLVIISIVLGIVFAPVSSLIYMN